MSASQQGFQTLRLRHLPRASLPSCHWHSEPLGRHPEGVNASPLRGCPHPKSRARGGGSEVAVPINRANRLMQVASTKACSPPLW